MEASITKKHEDILGLARWRRRGGASSARPSELPPRRSGDLLRAKISHPIDRASKYMIKSGGYKWWYGAPRILGWGGVVDDAVAAEMMNLWASNWAQHGAP